MKRWHELISPEAEKCNYCKRVIRPFESYFRQVYEWDTKDNRGKNVCQDCVAERETKLDL